MKQAYIFTSKLEATNKYGGYTYKDIFDLQVKELGEIGYGSNITPKYVAYPFRKIIIKMVDKDALFALRTNRNQLLINKQEQQLLKRKNIGVVGLSIGSSIALSLAYCGIGYNYRLADFDILSTTNLNRVHTGLFDVGEPKIYILARQISELDPFINLTNYSSGVDTTNITQYINQPDKLDLIFEEIDDFEMKIKVRYAAKMARVPVVMMTNLEDSILVDIEAYNVDANLPIFNGLIPQSAIEEIINGEITEADKAKYAVLIVGRENVPLRAIESLARIGQDLVGRPQLYSTVTSAGGIAGYLAKKILLDSNIESGRYKIEFDRIFNGEKLYG